MFRATWYEGTAQLLSLTELKSHLFEHSPDDQTQLQQAGTGEEDFIHLPSGLDRVACERQEEEDFFNWKSITAYRLVGLVVKASASRAEDPGFESRLRRDFSGVESYQ